MLLINAQLLFVLVQKVVFFFNSLDYICQWSVHPRGTEGLSQVSQSYYESLFKIINEKIII